MQSYILFVLGGLIIGTLGTLIGAGGGFILVPLLLIFYPELPPEVVTAISIAVVAVNAISGSAAYARSGRIDYKAGIMFALYTVPGSVIGPYLVDYIPIKSFNIIFGILLFVLSIYLIYKNRKSNRHVVAPVMQPSHKHTVLTDRQGHRYEYSYSPLLGNIVSVIVGFISPLLGIGGGIIHVPAMVNWLKFPVHIATATSHFILAIMATVTVIVHAVKGTYSDPEVVKMVLLLALGVVPGAQLGARLSHKIKSHVIIQALAGCLILVGIRILIKSF